MLASPCASFSRSVLLRLRRATPRRGDLPQAAVAVPSPEEIVNITLAGIAAGKQQRVLKRPAAAAPADKRPPP